MSQPETQVVNAIRRELERRGCVVVKMHGSAFSRKGFPDLLVVRGDGVTVYLEVKVPGRVDGPAGNGLSALQLRWLRVLEGQGAPVGWADSVDGAVAVVFGA